MTRQQGLWFPDDVGTKWKHTFRHVGALEWALSACVQHRTAVQAGGNIGAWPRRMADVFDRVYTFEPDAISRACLMRNVPPQVVVSDAALGASAGRCSIARASLGSHQVMDGSDVPVTTVDALELNDVDLLQLDVEGYELHALKGAAATIGRCLPVVQVELRDFTVRYGGSDAEVVQFLAGFGYRQVMQLPGNDVVFQVVH